jgi:hypothetical protein
MIFSNLTYSSQKKMKAKNKLLNLYTLGRKASDLVLNQDKLLMKINLKGTQLIQKCILHKNLRQMVLLIKLQIVQDQ